MTNTVSVQYLKYYNVKEWGPLVIKDGGIFNLRVAVSETLKILKNETAIIHTGVIIIPPVGYVIEITPLRSISVGGIILTNSPLLIYNYYNKEICLIIENIKSIMHFNPGEFIAKGRLSNIVNFEFKTKETLDE